MMDTHALAVSSAQPGAVFLAVRMGLFKSADRGATWEDMEIGRFSPLTYGRDVRRAGVPARPAHALCLSEPRRAERGRLALPERGPRPELAAPRPRRESAEHDDGNGATCQGPGPGVLRDAGWPGLRHPGRRPHLERVRLNRGRGRRLHHRLLLSDRRHSGASRGITVMPLARRLVPELGHDGVVDVQRRFHTPSAPRGARGARQVSVRVSERIEVCVRRRVPMPCLARAPRAACPCRDGARERRLKDLRLNTDRRPYLVAARTRTSISSRSPSRSFSSSSS
jgi:hypothetical protein